jgi:hypothetical protein
MLGTSFTVVRYVMATISFLEKLTAIQLVKKFSTF